MTGHRTTLKAEKINYQVLRKINPEAARLAVIEYLKTNKGNISEAARVFGIQRTVVYDILKKKEEGNLKDRSRAPLRSPYKTPGETESESCINFCEYFFSNIADLWQSAELGLKQRFQKLIFPENISYKKGRFQTTKIALIFKAFDEKSSPNYCQAPQTERVSQLLYER